MGTSHGLQRAPHLHLVEMAQRRGVETEVGVLRNVATGAKVPVFAAHQYATYAGPELQVNKHRTQLQPHAARHGVELARVLQGHGGNSAIQGERNGICHGPGPSAFANLFQRNALGLDHGRPAAHLSLHKVAKGLAGQGRKFGPGVHPGDLDRLRV